MSGGHIQCCCLGAGSGALNSLSAAILCYVVILPASVAALGYTLTIFKFLCLCPMQFTSLLLIISQMTCLDCWYWLSFSHQYLQLPWHDVQKLLSRNLLCHLFHNDALTHLHHHKVLQPNSQLSICLITGLCSCPELFLVRLLISCTSSKWLP